MPSPAPPLLIASAPNGAYKTRRDHRELPVTAAQLADTAVAVYAAGARMLHLHVRDARGKHTLSSAAYAAAVHAIRAAVGDNLFIQATSESAGVYTAAEQRAALYALSGGGDVNDAAAETVADETETTGANTETVDTKTKTSAIDTGISDAAVKITDAATTATETSDTDTTDDESNTAEAKTKTTDTEIKTTDDEVETTDTTVAAADTGITAAIETKTTDDETKFADIKTKTTAATTAADTEITTPTPTPTPPTYINGVSIAPRELIRAPADIAPAAKLFRHLRRRRIAIQYILYSPADIAEYKSLLAQQIIPPDLHSVLLVVGRHDAAPAVPALHQMLDALLAAPKVTATWMTCAFGADEFACLTETTKLGGHIRVGFENAIHLQSGRIAADNCELIAQLLQHGNPRGRAAANIAQARGILGVADL